MQSEIERRGLSDAEVIESRSNYGTNVLTSAGRTPWWKDYLRKFADPMIIVLLVAGALSMGIACYEYFELSHGSAVFFEPAGIFLALIMASTLSFIFEQRANRAFRLLNAVNDDESVQVVRNGVAAEVPRRDVVVGDIVIINTGDEIPADGDLLEAVTLGVDESSLTGEPHCYKTADPTQQDAEATFPSNRVLRGSKVMEGHGVMRVTHVGDSTETGKVFAETQIDDSVRTPLNEQLDGLAHRLTILSYTLAALIIAGRLIHLFCFTDWQALTMVELSAQLLKALMMAVTLIVVSVPEGLPMAVTLSLAYSMRRMLKTNNLVRKMHACETMGATTVICTDKTGTLTQNLMQVDDTVFFGPESEVYADMALNSTAQLNDSKVIGNPTEGALLLWLKSRGIDYLALRGSYQRIEEEPFSTERKYMSTLVEAPDGRRTLYVKGAPEIVYAMCGDNGGISRRELDGLLLGYQNRAMRTLAFAYRKADMRKLTFLGIAAISDPVRADVAEAVDEVLNAGIKVKIVTGDTSATAREIARLTGLWDDATDSDRNIITGPEVAALSDAELRQRIGDFKIIARARPLDKKRLVEALRANGEVVAVTGDGTNDAPALKAAHVGLSMGDGTSVAKEASDITILDNSFASIGRAVMWGRSLYKNIRRFLLFQLTVNVAACLLVLVASFIGVESPLSITQMLWINLIMDTFGGMALASLPPSSDVMREKPRPRSAFILSRPMLRELIGIGVIFFTITIGFYWIFTHADVTSLTGLGNIRLGEAAPMTPYEATLLFSIFVWTHFWYMFNTRAFESGRSIFRLRMGSAYWAIVGIIILGQLFITEVAYEFFNVTPMLRTLSGTIDLLIIVAASSVVVLTRELARLISGGR